MILVKNVFFAFLIAFSALSTLNAQDVKTYNRPQKPVPPFPYHTEEVRYQNATDTSVHLAATLTLPKGNGPFAAVLLIGGSGLFPRDAHYYGHNSEQVLSDYLTKLGIATLRYDERGTGSSTRGPKKLSELVDEDHVADAKAGIDYLRSRPEIDNNKIGIIGGSAGTLYASRIAAEFPDQIGFIVLLVPAAYGLTKGQIVAHQSAKMLQVANASAEARRADSIFIARSLYYTKNEKDRDKRYKSIKAIADEELSKLSPKDTAVLARGFGIKARILASEEFHQSATATSPDYLKMVKCPVLTINGGKDVLIDGYYTVPRLRQSLKESGNEDYQVELFPTLNHMMQTANTGLMEEAEHIEETFAPAALRLIGTWVVDHSIKYKGYYDKKTNKFVYPTR